MRMAMTTKKGKKNLKKYEYLRRWWCAVKDVP